MTAPTAPEPPLARWPARSMPQWRGQVERLLRLPGSNPDFEIFRPDMPARDIAIALGAMDAEHNVASDWVPIAQRILGIQKCCISRVLDDDVDFIFDDRGNLTPEWHAAVLADVNRLVFATTCASLVPFVLRNYLSEWPWARYNWPEGIELNRIYMIT